VICQDWLFQEITTIVAIAITFSNARITKEQPLELSIGYLVLDDPNIQPAHRATFSQIRSGEEIRNSTATRAHPSPGQPRAVVIQTRLSKLQSQAFHSRHKLQPIVCTSGFDHLFKHQMVASSPPEQGRIVVPCLRPNGA